MHFREAQGVQVPVLGFGTYPLKGPAGQESILRAIECGYRHLDTAQMYENEFEVGRAIQESKVPRDEFFVTTKVWSTHLTPDGIPMVAQQSLEKLGLDRIDLFLIHWPTPDMKLEACLDAMLSLREKGLIRMAGVSNFSVSLLERAKRSHPGFVACHQFECNPFSPQHDLIQYGAREKMMMTAYTPLARGAVEKNPVLKDIGKKYGKSASQVTLRWLIQLPFMTTIPKAARLEHIQANFDIFDFELTATEMARISTLSGA